MNAKHTSGPWTFYDAPGAGLQICATAGAIANQVKYFAEPAFNSEAHVMEFTLRMKHSTQPIGIADERWVQFEPKGWHEMQEANARLIAAAPELLEACERALEALELEYGEGSADYLTAAIRKAKEGQ